MFTKLIIVRHGETAWNKEGRKQGHANTSLSKKGKTQARQLSEFLKGEKIGCVYSSDLPRALKSAELIASPHGLKVRKDKLLREIDLGLCEGLTKEEMKLKFPEFFEKRKNDYFGVPYPKGESPNDVRKRVLKFLDKIERAKGIVLIVSHNGFNRNLVNYLSSSLPEQVSGSEFGHGTVAEFDSGKAKMRLRKIG